MIKTRFLEKALQISNYTTCICDYCNSIHVHRVKLDAGGRHSVHSFTALHISRAREDINLEREDSDVCLHCITSRGLFRKMPFHRKVPSCVQNDPGRITQTPTKPSSFSAKVKLIKCYFASLSVAVIQTIIWAANVVWTIFSTSSTLLSNHYIYAEFDVY